MHVSVIINIMVTLTFRMSITGKHTLLCNAYAADKPLYQKAHQTFIYSVKVIVLLKARRYL